jgi:molybdenum cofactor cytidylyltransferase
MTPILILAAGKSSRMRGRDKHLEEIDGVPLLRRLALAALELGEPVFVALPALPHPRAAALGGLDVSLLAIPEAEEGMSGTLRGAVAQLAQSEGFLLVLGDLAEIGTAEMRAVIAAPADAPDKLIWRGATETGEPGHPILFDASLIPRFAELSGDGGGESLVKPLKPQTCLVPLPGRVARHDLDTPEDWAAFRKKTPRA